MTPAEDFWWRIDKAAALNEWWRDLGSGTIPALSVSKGEVNG